MKARWSFGQKALRLTFGNRAFSEIYRSKSACVLLSGAAYFWVFTVLQRFTYIALSSIVAARELAHVLKRQRLVQPEALIVATERETFVQD